MSLPPHNEERLRCRKFLELTDLLCGTLLPCSCSVCGRSLPPHTFERYAEQIVVLQDEERRGPAGTSAYAKAHAFFDSIGLLLPDRQCCRAIVCGFPELLEMVHRVAERPDTLYYALEETRNGEPVSSRTYFDIKPEEQRWLLEPTPMPPLLRAWAKEATPFSIVTDGCKEFLYALIHHIRTKEFHFTIPSRGGGSVAYDVRVGLHFKNVGNVAECQGTSFAPVFGDLEVSVDAEGAAPQRLRRRNVLLGGLPVAASHETVLKIGKVLYSPILSEVPASNHVLVTRARAGLQCKTVSLRIDGWDLAPSLMPLVLSTAHFKVMKKGPQKAAGPARQQPVEADMGPSEGSDANNSDEGGVYDAALDCNACNLSRVFIRWKGADGAPPVRIPIVLAISFLLRQEDLHEQKLEEALLCEAPLLRASKVYSKFYQTSVQRWAAALCKDVEASPEVSREDLERLRRCLPHLDGIEDPEARDRAKAHHVIRMLARILEVLLGVRDVDDVHVHKAYVGVARTLVNEATSALEGLKQLFKIKVTEDQLATGVLSLPLAERELKEDRSTLAADDDGALISENAARNCVAQYCARGNPLQLVAVPALDRERLCAHCGAHLPVVIGACPSCNGENSVVGARLFSVSYKPIRNIRVEQLDDMLADGEVPVRWLCMHLLDGLEACLRNPMQKHGLLGAMAKLLSGRERRRVRSAHNLQTALGSDGVRRVCNRITLEQQGLVTRFTRGINPHSRDEQQRKARACDIDFVDHREVDENNPGQRGALSMNTLFSVPSPTRRCCLSLSVSR